MEPSIFTRIIRGDIPAYKVYEDDKTLAFLDIHPAMPGHVLVIPKTQVDRLEDLSDEDYTAVMQTVRMVMKRIVEVFGANYRACVKVIGFDVPHAHVQVLPCRRGKDFQQLGSPADEPDHNALAAMAEKLAL